MLLRELSIREAMTYDDRLVAEQRMRTLDGRPIRIYKENGNWHMTMRDRSQGVHLKKAVRVYFMGSNVTKTTANIQEVISALFAHVR